MNEDINEIIEVSNKYLSKMYKRYYPFIPERAFDDIIYSIDGTAYIDLYGGISIANIGWSNPKVIKAVEEQLNKFFHMPSVYYLKHTARLAKKLAELSPGRCLTKCFFLNSGSEAVETAIAISKRVKKKPYIISLHRSFHGKTYYAVSLTGQANWKLDIYPLAPVVFAPVPYCYRCSLGHSEPSECSLSCVNYIEDIIKCEIGNNASAFIAEPMLANGGIIIPPKEYFKEVKKILDKYSILFIADEVQSGNGRSGKLWAIEHYNVIPDIMTTSKALANGIPISVVMYKEELDQFLTPGEHYSTFGGNALACVAAEVVLEELTHGLIKEVAEKGEYFIKRLNELKDKYDIIGDVRGMGLLIGIELVKNRLTKTPAKEEAFNFIQEAWKKKILVGIGGLEGNVIRIEPPLTIKKEHIDYAIEMFDSILKNIK
ncbi:MAG: aspartate aminotransferase family protein [Candidatus Methanomethylicaceae archaeon]|nr:aspartate aminotransferase family protein [Candidatus Verstraetearchaeota archaeon]